MHVKGLHNNVVEINVRPHLTGKAYMNVILSMIFQVPNVIDSYQ